MLDIGWTELLLIAAVAVVVIGPQDLPKAMRMVGKWSGKMKRMARDFQGQFNEALREAELDTVKKDFDELSKVDPVASVRKEVSKTTGDIQKDLNKPLPSAKPTALKSEAASETKPEAKAGPANRPSVDVAPIPAAAPAAGESAAAGDVKP